MSARKINFSIAIPERDLKLLKFFVDAVNRDHSPTSYRNKKGYKLTKNRLIERVLSHFVSDIDKAVYDKDKDAVMESIRNGLRHIMDTTSYEERDAMNDLNKILDSNSEV